MLTQDCYLVGGVCLQDKGVGWITNTQYGLLRQSSFELLKSTLTFCIQIGLSGFLLFMRLVSGITISVEIDAIHVANWRGEGVLHM